MFTNGLFGVIWVGNNTLAYDSKTIKLFERRFISETNCKSFIPIAVAEKKLMTYFSVMLSTYAIRLDALKMRAANGDKAKLELFRALRVLAPSISPRRRGCKVSRKGEVTIDLPLYTCQDKLWLGILTFMVVTLPLLLEDDDDEEDDDVNHTGFYYRCTSYKIGTKIISDHL